MWVERYNGPGNNYNNAKCIALDSGNNVYVTGTCFGNGTYMDYATIKYSQPIGIKPISNEIPNEYKLHQNYPNPFNPVTKIGVRIARFRFVKLIVYDILG